MKKIIFILVFALSTLGFAQEQYDSENYRVSLSDLKPVSYEKDSTANALVIYEYGNSYFDPNDYVLKTEIKKR